LLDLRQIHDREVVVVAGIGVDRKGDVNENLLTIRGVLEVGNRVAPPV